MTRRNRRRRRDATDFYTNEGMSPEAREELLRVVAQNNPSTEAARVAVWLIAALRHQPPDLRSITRALDALTRAARHGGRTPEQAAHLSAFLNDLGDQILSER